MLEDRGYMQKLLSYILVYARQIFYFFYFSIYEMVDSEYSKDIYKPIKISIGTVIRNPEILKVLPYHFKARKICMDAF